LLTREDFLLVALSVERKGGGRKGEFAFNVHTQKFNPYALFQESSFCSDFPGFSSMRTYFVKLGDDAVVEQDLKGCAL
jgi:hypothetical protein